MCYLGFISLVSKKYELNVMSKENLPVGFRLDINGLRAWAVLAVVFYHWLFIASA